MTQPQQTESLTYWMRHKGEPGGERFPITLAHMTVAEADMVEEILTRNGTTRISRFGEAGCRYWFNVPVSLLGGS